MAIRSASGYERLEVYQRAMTLVGQVQSVIQGLPSSERYALASQMRRGSRSVPANIAEGYSKRKPAKEFRNYLAIAMGSANEMRVHLTIAKELGYVRDEHNLVEQYDTLGRQLNKLIGSWKAGAPRNPEPTTNNQQPRG